MSSTISRIEKLFSLQLDRMDRLDAVGRMLLQRVSGLLEARSDIDRDEFGRRIHRGRPWISEYFSGQRTTNNLRLVAKMAKVFGVTVGYLLGESKADENPQRVTLLSVWDELPPPDQGIVLQTAVMLRQRVVAPEYVSTPEPSPAANTTKARAARR